MCATRSSTTATSSRACSAKGAVFVEELDEMPDTDAPVVFSAHGVPKSVPDEASRRNFVAIDATCPLVTKVHREAELHFRARPRDHPDRPCRPSRGDRHDGPAAAGRGAAGRRPPRRPRPSCRTIPTSSPMSRRRRCRSTTPRRSSPLLKRALPRASRVRTRRTSATPPPTARRRSSRSRRWSTP